MHLHRMVCIRIAAMATVVAGLFMSGGCSSPSARGTPFYSGEEKATERQSDERLSLWPLVYYRPPVWSFLWPIFEGGDDYITVRPFYSRYLADDSNRVTDVLWPIAHVGDVNNRIVPVFWGDNYCCAVPFYWRFGDPFSSRGGSVTIPPFWSYRRNDQGTETYVLWPFIHSLSMGEQQERDVWPLYGVDRRGSYEERYFLWPLGRAWDDGSSGLTRYGSYFFPAYASWRNAERTGFLSLLGWRFTGQNQTQWGVLPLLSAGTEQGTAYERWFVGPLSHVARDAQGNTSSHVLPLYAQSSSSNSSYFLSLPWSQGITSNGTAWRVVPPVFASWKRRSELGGLVSPLGWRTYGSGATNWGLLPLLSWGTERGEGYDRWYVGPMAHQRRTDDGARSSYVAPLFYRSASSTNGSLFVSLPWSAGQRTNGTAWQFIPPVFFRSTGPKGNGLITPLYAKGGSSDRSRSWSSVIPLYYRQESSNGVLVATLVGGWNSRSNGHSWLIYPFLSKGRVDGDTSDLWLAAPLCRVQHDAAGLSAMHVLPLFWWNRDSRLFLSPIAARWEDKQKREVTLIPPLLSATVSAPNRFDLYAVLGLAHGSWGGASGSSHVIPFYYRNPQTETFVSPAYARWKTPDGGTTRALPFVASWASSGWGQTNISVLGPLAHWGIGPNTSRHVFPLFYSDDHGGVISIPWAQWTDHGTQNKVVPPLLSRYKAHGSDKTLTMLLGLGEERWGGAYRDGYLFPLYAHKKDQYLYTPLFGRNIDPAEGFLYPLTPLVGAFTGTRYSGTWAFPLYVSKCERATGDRRTWFMLLGRQITKSNSTDSAFFPLYHYRCTTESAGRLEPDRRYGTTWWSLPWIWYKNIRTTPLVPSKNGLPAPTIPGDIAGVDHIVSHGCFPLWSFSSISSNNGSYVSNRTSYLFYLGSAHKQIQPGPSGTPIVSSTSRFLWKAWYCERQNDTVSVDVFPAITYDRTGDAHKSVSFLWRVFRYERNGTECRVHLFFVPVWHSDRH